jgi:hypothetical protein
VLQNNIEGKVQGNSITAAVGFGAVVIGFVTKIFTDNDICL